MSRGIICIPPVESISGKFARVQDTCNKKSRYGTRRWIGGMVKPTSLRNFMVIREKPITFKSDTTANAAKAKQDLFTFAQKWRETTLSDPQLKASATAAYADGGRTVGVKADSYATLSGFVFAVRYAQKVANPELTTSSADYTKWPAAD